MAVFLADEAGARRLRPATVARRATAITYRHPVEQPAALDLAGELEAVESYALAGLSPATLRAYASDWRGLQGSVHSRFHPLSVVITALLATGFARRSRSPAQPRLFLTLGAVGDKDAVPPRAVILTALPIEYAAVRAHLRDVGSYGDPRHVNWERGRFVGRHATWDVLIAETGAENVPAATETERVLADFEAQAAIYVGIAGGLKDKGVRAGDVIIPPRVHHYGSGKSADADSERPRGETASRPLFLAAQRVARDSRWKADLDEADEARARLEPIASGDRVVKSVRSGTYNLLRSHAEDAVAVDMESGGFLHAAAQREGVRRLVVRGVSDLLADKKPEDDQTRQPRAARHAAAFAFATLDDVYPDPQSRAERATGASLDVPRELAERAVLERWARWTEGYFHPTPYIDIDDSERLEILQAWLAAHVPAEPVGPIPAALANFARVLADLELVLHYQMEVREHQYWTFPWYRNWHGDPRELERWHAHVLLIHNLAAELTRAMNLIRDRGRQIDPTFLEREGAAVVFAGPDYALAVQARYSPEESDAPQPYPGFEAFPHVLAERDGSFGVGRDPKSPSPNDLAPWVAELVARRGPGSPSP